MGFQRPEFPEGMPEEIKKEITDKLNKIEESYEFWADKLKGFDKEEELIGLALALQEAQHNAMVANVAEMPEVQKAVMAKMAQPLPEVIPLPASNSGNRDRMN